jgi:hypothetical protein
MRAKNGKKQRRLILKKGFQNCKIKDENICFRIL